ncbi:MAG: aromatic ring-hydroxylating oxygenase subunit alpha [Gammaproteobacteria bacterium]
MTRPMVTGTPPTALPPAFYLGADRLATDMRAVHARGWQLVAHASDLAGAGDHVVTRIADAPVIVVRGDDGVLRAFPNVCRHRAGPLALANGRGARMLHCRYHGWIYGLDGRLKRAPEMQDATGFDPRDVRLPLFAVAEWLGLVFVSLAATPVQFPEVVAGIAERIAPADFAPMRHVHSRNYEVACNWKVYVDNYVEGYHLPYVHPGLTQALDYRSYHTETARWHSLQHSPVAADGATYGEGHAFYYFLYPNTMLNVMPGRLQTNRVLPAGLERCRVEFHYYYLPDPQAEARIAADLAFTDRVQVEDGAICEQVQLGLASGFYDPGRLCPRHEGTVAHFHRLLLEDYARETEVPA